MALNITALPVEIVETIADYISLVSFESGWTICTNLRSKESPVPQSDIANLRTTCQYASVILAPRVLFSVSLNLSDCRNAQHLIWMAAGPNRVHKLARSLKITSFAPSNTATHFAPNIRVEMGGSYKYLDQPATEDMVEAVQTASRYLPEALRHFHCLESVQCVYIPESFKWIFPNDEHRWNTHAFDIPNANQVVMDMLCLQGNLQRVYIDMSCDLTFPYPQLHRLSKLSEFSVTFPRIHMEAGPIFIGVAEALRNSPGLTNLQVIFQADYPHNDVQDRGKIYTHMASLNNVKKLSLYATAPREFIDFFTLIDMRYLTSLEIRPEYGTEGFGEVWNSLKEKGIHLKNICFNILHMETAFVRYISSYSGIEMLWLSNEERHWINISLNHTDLAAAFFDSIVENHADTLQVLDIRRNYLEAWGNVRGRVNKLAQLRILRRLEIELPEVERAYIAASSSNDYVSFSSISF